ncbi:transposase [Herbinix luporum]|jgi:transposase|uniref:Insertion element IS150 protein InsJ-like helix-turn-helix domain-containing protein n=1 Tax=Herbinix luporum TaxID=1679721 RepID=A0A0K8J2J5_9FIRM|nr:transposase [Herbinix luporum]CUH91861.1 hypothetical protein SD1D_0308 [Herbinix luporum]
MAKYSFEFKKEVVVAYLSSKGSTYSLAKDYGIPDNKQVSKWVNSYQKMGDEGLRRSRRYKNYSVEYKISVVELYLSNELSYQELSLQQGINNPALIAKWVNDFRIAGPEALRVRKKGRKKTLDKSCDSAI